MSSDGWLALIVVVIALVILAAAAMVQMVVAGSSRSRVQIALGQEPDAPGRQRGRGGIDPRQGLIATMVLIQVLTAIIAASMLTIVFDQTIAAEVDWLAIAVVIMLYLIFGQIVPRAADEKELDPHLERIVGIGRTGAMLVAPVSWLIDVGTRWTRGILPGSLASTIVDDNEDVRSRHHSDVLEEIGEVERQMVEGILGLESTSVREIMVPRLDIIGVERNVPPQELIETITKAGHSRIPVYLESIDTILGVLYAKDLLPFVIGTTNRIPLLDLVRPAFVVPESKQVVELFAELKRTQVHLAIVADEYGGTAGLVTIEDILEEIVGEIQDEYDSEVPLFAKEGVDVLLADGRLPIEDVEDALNVQFEEDEDFGTLGGFVHKHLSRLPVQGDAFEAEGVRVEIIAVERQRVRQLRLTKIRESDRLAEDRDGLDDGRVTTVVPRSAERDGGNERAG
ncbi:hemolysin family protein [soil metagenome]